MQGSPQNPAEADGSRAGQTASAHVGSLNVLDAGGQCTELPPAAAAGGPCKLMVPSRDLAPSFPRPGGAPSLSFRYPRNSNFPASSSRTLFLLTLCLLALSRPSDPPNRLPWLAYSTSLLSITPTATFSGASPFPTRLRSETAPPHIDAPHL